jgi:uracil-DNA glycosylase family 4
MTSDISSLCADIVSCGACPRLVRWREKVAREKVRRFATEEYWGKPLPGFGDPEARLLIVGLAPAAHGGNRTGRMFTGDRSGDWLFRALHDAGFANQRVSLHRNDGLTLSDCYITAAVRCAPPQNKPTAVEFRRCRPFLEREVELLRNVRVVVGLGKIGFESALQAFASVHGVRFRKKPVFRHGAVYASGGYTFLASYHPSQQNTFTGRLTERMLLSVLRRARGRIKGFLYLR